VLSPMVVLAVLDYARRKTYEDAANERAHYRGEPTQAQIEAQRGAGWEYTGKADASNMPIWKYKPSLAQRVKDAIFYLTNPVDFKSGGDFGNSEPKKFDPKDWT
jgi:hypothetical protein